MRNIKEKRGITLIVLAVTIVVILILAGVTIDVTLGQNGILEKSKETANRMNNLVKEDETELNELLNELNETMDSNWNSNIEIPEENTIPEPDPEPPKIEDVTDIQDETIQVEDEYGNKVTIPKGFEVVEEEGTTVPEGIVIQDKVGNQFVWIPVGRVYKDSTGTNYSDIHLGRYTFNTTNGTPTLVQVAYTNENAENYNQLININMSDGSDKALEYATRSNPEGTNELNAIAKDLAEFVNSVRENEGYYLARYEASYGSGSSVLDFKPLSKISKTTNFSRWTIGSLWNNVTQTDAAKISRNMYNNDSSVGVESDLVNSYTWDTAIVFIQAMGNVNYANKLIENSKLLNTGTTGDEVCNINDMASNCAEWTTEYSGFVNGGKQYHGVSRGGAYNAIVVNYNTAFRFSQIVSSAGEMSSFRVICYIK